MYLIVAFSAWFLAQFIKLIISFITRNSKQQSIKEILFGSGGMPSSHSATTVSLATYIFWEQGIDNPITALAIVFSFIVMYDAMNVRRETGRQGKYLNEMVELLDKLGENIPLDKKFKELVGHTPLQVIMGGLLGLCVGSFMYYLLWLN